MVDRQLKLYDYVTKKHGDQKRKDGSPYRGHLLNVAKTADSIGVYMGFEAGLCHDLLEDTHCTVEELNVVLRNLGYTWGEVSRIVYLTTNLTDEFTKENYPNDNRKKRKLWEANRISKLDSDSQTLKLCDILDNLRSIHNQGENEKFDENFIPVYLKEKIHLLCKMTKGNRLVHNQCFEELFTAQKKYYHDRIL